MGIVGRPEAEQVAWDAECREKGFPWCDTCGHAAVWCEFTGWCHSTRDYPFGIPTSDEQAMGHEVTARQWWATEVGNRLSGA